MPSHAITQAGIRMHHTCHHTCHHTSSEMHSFLIIGSSSHLQAAGHQQATLAWLRLWPLPRRLALQTAHSSGHSQTGCSQATSTHRGGGLQCRWALHLAPVVGALVLECAHERSAGGRPRMLAAHHVALRCTCGLSCTSGGLSCGGLRKHSAAGPAGYGC